ncbi:MAG: 50S ribosomal protein L4 [bacterium]|nr:50S ribosomal protein L4 [bacterium]
MESIIYNQIGKQVGKITLPESVFGVKWNADLVHQVATSMASSARSGTAHAKTRGEVRGTGKKPWKQKGTGRARHGSRRSPLWVGGGVTHGPRNEKNYTRKVSKKMKAKALYVILSRKFKENELVLVDNILISEPKTKEAKKIINSLSSISGVEKLSSKKKNAAYIAIPEKAEAVEKSFSNIGSLRVDELRNINPLDILSAKYIVFVKPEEAFKFLESKL